MYEELGTELSIIIWSAVGNKLYPILRVNNFTLSCGQKSCSLHLYHLRHRPLQTSWLSYYNSAICPLNFFVIRLYKFRVHIMKRKGIFSCKIPQYIFSSQQYPQISSEFSLKEKVKTQPCIDWLSMQSISYTHLSGWNWMECGLSALHNWAVSNGYQPLDATYQVTRYASAHLSWRSWPPTSCIICQSVCIRAPVGQSNDVGPVLQEMRGGRIQFPQKRSCFYSGKEFHVQNREWGSICCIYMCSSRTDHV